MIYKKRISITVFSGLIVEILNKIAPLIIIHIAQKRLGIEKFGYALFGISVIELVLPVISFGYNQYGVIAAGKDPSAIPKLMSSIFVLKLGHCIGLLACLYLFFGYVPAYQSYFSLIMPLSLLLAVSVVDVLWVQSASQKVAVSNVFIGICRLVTLILILIFIKNSQDAILFAILSLVGNALVNLSTCFYSVYKFGLAPPDWIGIRTIFQKSLPYSVVILLTIVSERIDIFFAEHFGGLAGAGYYAGSSRLGHSLTQIANTIIAAFFSEMVIIQDKQSLSSHMRWSLWILLFFLSPFIFGVWFVAGDVLSFIFDEKFRAIESVLGWIFLSASLSVLTASFGQQVLFLTGQIRTYAKALALGVLISSTLAYLVGGTSLYAIAIAMCIGKFFTTFIVFMAARKSLVEFPIAILFKTLGPGFLMGLVLFVLQLPSFFANVGLGAVVFFFFGFMMNRREFLGLYTQVLSFVQNKDQQ